MFTESDLLPLSALQHLLFCERQCALIHIEGLWAENRHTLEGHRLHDKAHDGPSETRHALRIARGLPLRSLRLGISGIADVVEFHPAAPAESTDPRPPIPFPVEYKRGKPKANDADRVQLCAQALCLEEMLNTPVPAGALYYGRTRRRLDVAIDTTLRQTTENAAQKLHQLIHSGVTPRASRQPKCDNCSLLNLCLPSVTGPQRSASRYLTRSLASNTLHTPSTHHHNTDLNDQQP